MIIRMEKINHKRYSRETICTMRQPVSCFMQYCNLWCNNLIEHKISSYLHSIHSSQETNFLVMYSYLGEKNQFRFKKFLFYFNFFNSYKTGHRPHHHLPNHWCYVDPVVLENQQLWRNWWGSMENILDSVYHIPPGFVQKN